MNLAKINEVVKASPAIQIQSKISLFQRRAWNVLLANAYKIKTMRLSRKPQVRKKDAKSSDIASHDESVQYRLMSLRCCPDIYQGLPIARRVIEKWTHNPYTKALNAFDD